MTSLMDLTFLLLITFIITFPLIEQGVPVNLPKGKASPLEAPDSTSISLNAKGELYVDDVLMTEEAFAAEIAARAEIDPDMTVLVRADEALPYGKIVTVLRVLHSANITRMALVTDPANPPAVP